MDKCKVCDCYSEKQIETRKAQKVIDEINSGKGFDFGEPDLLGGLSSYFPSEFVEIVDYDKVLIRTYEKSIEKYHVDLAHLMIV